jgi:hypothetical protein
MKQIIQATEVDGQIKPAHEIEIFCANCSYDLDPSEVQRDTCADCGATLNLGQSVSIHATSVPAAGARTMGS